MTPSLTTDLSQLLAEGQAWMVHYGLVFARIGAFFTLLPVFGERVVPARVRLISALAMTVIVAPALAGQVPPVPDTLIRAALFIGAETLVGLTLAIGLRLLVMVLQMAGTMAAQATSLSQAFGGAGIDPQPAFSQVLVMAGLAVIVVSGLPERLAALLVLSYEIFPSGQWLDASALAQWGVSRVAHAFGLAFTLAAPFVIGSGLYNLALGAINRAMPQLMVAFVGAPALTFGGLFLMLISAPLMISIWLSTFAAMSADPALMIVP
ncbi:flagellar biosynthetic protein FliR [Pararhodobacter oceanensis]|uniref:flagellar biosynthetic protein FliR n=1 Tax=Pararhodobacter oceanensis TaxID=2172121 RepID=UPI003A90B2A6